MTTPDGRADLQPVAIPRGRAVGQHLALQLTTKGLLLAQTVVVARLYGPEPLGALALLLLVVNGFATATSLGLDRYLLQSELNGIRARLDASFTLSSGTGLAAVLLLWLAAPALLGIFDAELYTGELRALSVVLLLQTVLLPVALWERELRLVRANLPGVIAPFVFIGAAALAAWYGDPDVEALVLAQIASVAATAVFVWASARQRPRFTGDRRAMADALSFGVPLLLSGSLGFLIGQGDDLLVRLFNDDRALGLYAVAFYLPAQLLTLVDVIGRVAVAAMADLRDSQPALKQAFREFSGYIAMLAVGAGLGLALLARPLVLVLYGREWLEIVPLVQIFSLAFMIRGVTGFHWQALALLFGRTRYILRASILSVLFLAVVAPPLIWYLGLYGGAVYSLAQLAVMGPLIRFPLIREILGDLSFLGASLRPLLAGTAAVAVAVPVLVAVPIPLLDAGLAGLTFAATYLVLLARFEPLLLQGAREVIGR